MKKIRVQAKAPKTTSLLPHKSFIVGMGSIFNLRGQYFDYNKSDSSLKADSKALQSDWEMTGEDLRKAQRNFQKSL